jgi:hypothetical protein
MYVLNCLQNIIIKKIHQGKTKSEYPAYTKKYGMILNLDQKTFGYGVLSNQNIEKSFQLTYQKRGHMFLAT